jgi:hypothetical protein
MQDDDIIVQVLIQSSRLYEGQETLILTEMNANSLNLGSAVEQGVFTGNCFLSFEFRFHQPVRSRMGNRN